ncbi:SDR family NAD(P)-dependent oxidoreductase [Mycolicibacterium chubuense]|nr:SDR family oxidoreductase [Mycolicibacterium chubuense]
MLPGVSDTGAALVTGASSGIGEEIARELARRGHRVILVARRADRLHALAQSLDRVAHVLPADLSNPADRAALPDQVAALSLTVDVLVNNAGVSNLGPVARVSPEAELALVEVDVAAVVDLCSRFVPGMVARGRGAVLNVASVGAFGPVPWQASYGAAKAFVLSYTEAMREELRGTGVTAAVVCPGPVRTGFGDAAGIPDEEAEKMLPKFLWEQPDAVARAALDGLDKGRPVIVPGAPNRAAALLYRFAPHTALLPLLGRSHPGRRK